MTYQLTVQINAETHDGIESALQTLHENWWSAYSQKHSATEISEDFNNGDVQIEIEMHTKGPEAPYYPKEGNLND